MDEDFCYCHNDYEDDEHDCLDYMECEECPYYYEDLDQELLNPYVVYESGNENDEPLEEFDSIDRLKEWCYLQKASAIACGKKPIEYYYNYCYSVEEGGDFI